MMKAKKDKRFDLMMDEFTYQNLCRLAIRESMKKQSHVSRAKWLRDQINKAAKRARLCQ
jgi:hypothetical protein